MASLPLILGVTAAGAQLAGGAVGGISSLTGGDLAARGQMLAGRDAVRFARYEAKQGKYVAKAVKKELGRLADLEESAGHARGRERLRDTRLLRSAQLARAAASGGGVANPTVLNLFEETERRGTELARSEIARGILDSKALRRRGAATILESQLAAPLIMARGKSALRDATFGAAGSRLSGTLGGVSSILSGIGGAASTGASAYARYR